MNRTLSLQNRLERLESMRGRVDGIAYVVLYDHAAQVRRWGGTSEWIPLLDALKLMNDPSIKVYQASDDFDPNTI